MAIMTATARSPARAVTVAPDRIVAHGVMRRIGLGGVEWQTFGYNALAHTLVGIAVSWLLGGCGCSAPTRGEPRPRREPEAEPFERNTGSRRRDRCADRRGGGLELDVGMVTLACAAVLILLRAARTRAIQPDAVGRILMVTGVSVLVALLGKTEGLTLISDGIAAVSTPTTIEAVAAFGTGLVSVYSSTSGVVLPAFPADGARAPERLGGIAPLPIAWSMT